MVCVGSSAIIKCHQVDSGGAFDPLNGVEFIFGHRGEPSPRVRTANPVGVEHPEHQETVPSSDAIVHCGVSLSVLAVRIGLNSPQTEHFDPAVEARSGSKKGRG